MPSIILIYMPGNAQTGSLLDDRPWRLAIGDLTHRNYRIGARDTTYFFGRFGAQCSVALTYEFHSSDSSK